MNTHIQSVEVGDLFRDNDRRLNGQRVVKVVAISGGLATVEVVEHWNEKLIGRRSTASVYRFEHGRDRQTGYTKVSH